MSTTSSTTSHPLSFTLSTAAHFTISTTNPTLTLWYQPTTTTLSIPIAPPLNTSYNTSSSPVNPNLPSTTTAKSKTTPSDTQSKHLPFTFLFIPNHPNYISKLKLPVNLAKLCTEIQRNVHLSIIKIVEEHLTKQNKRKNDETRKKKVHNFKPRFQPMEHPPTLPTHTDPKTDITTITQNMHEGFKKHMSTTITQYTQPIFKTTATQYTNPTFKTTATQYALPTSLNHSSTCTKSQHLPLNTTEVLYQPTNHHILEH